MIVHVSRRWCWRFVYTDAERERENHKERVVRRRETKGRREKIEIEKKKKRDRLVCVLVGGNWGDCLPPLPLPGPSQKPSGVPGFLRKNISAPHHPWTQRWAVYLGPAAWQLYWCYIQAHRDLESEREQEHRERRRRAEWRSEEDGGRVTRIEGKRNGTSWGEKERI